MKETVGQWHVISAKHNHNAFRIVKMMPDMARLLSRTDQASQVLLYKYPMKEVADLLLEFQLHSPLLDHEVSSSPE